MTTKNAKRWLRRGLLGLALLALAVGCGDDESSGTGASVKEVLTAWSEAGFDIEALKPLEEHGFGKATCRQGPIDGVETTLCLYENEGAASVERSAGLAKVGEATGAALVRGRMMLVVADRDKADPDGKTINKLTRIFLGRE